MTPEQKARVSIDALLVQAGWHVCNVADANIHAGSGDAKGVAIREFPLSNGFGFADYLLHVNGKACGVIEAKKEGATLTGDEVQSGRYAQGLPATLPAWRRPLPFFWESTGVETLAQRLQQSGLQRIEARELRRYRQFYLAYPQIRETASPEAALEQFKLIAGDLGGEVADL